MKNSICPAIRELERLYDILARESNLDKIAKRPIITIQTKGNQKNTLGWHWKDKWRYKKQKISEINICAESLSKNVVETLIHEMAHYHNASLNIKDCNSHQYHNKTFKDRAISYGLNVKKSGRLGWAETSISEDLRKTLSKLRIKTKLFTLYRQKNKSIKSITKMKKYTCGCTIVRCATDLRAICKTCESNFIQKD